MRRAWPFIVLLVGCRSDIYRGSDLQKVVRDEHSAFIAQQMALLKNGQAAELVRELSERARYPGKFETLRDQAQAALEKSLKLGGRVKSYRIVEAEKLKIKENTEHVRVEIDAQEVKMKITKGTAAPSADAIPTEIVVAPSGATVEDTMNGRAKGNLLWDNRTPQDGVTIRVNVQFERGSAEFEYSFFLIDGIWKIAGFQVKFWAASE